MVDVSLTNEKLRRRGLRILQEATGATRRDGQSARWSQSGNLRVALLMLKTGESAAEARRRLKQRAGNLRQALGDAFCARNAQDQLRRSKTDVRRRKD